MKASPVVEDPSEEKVGGAEVGRNRSERRERGKQEEQGEGN